MDNAFLKGLEQIKKVDPNMMVESIFQLFHSIEKMDIEELVAAKRTFNLFRSLNTVGEREIKILEQIDESMIARAGSLVNRGLQENFLVPLRSVFGDECCNKRILNEGRYPGKGLFGSRY